MAIGLAIENARRYEWEQGRTERLKLIARIGQIVTSDFRLNELLQRAADALHELLGYPNVAIPLIEAGDPPVLALNTLGGFYKAIVSGEYRLPITSGIMGAAASERRLQLVNDVARDPRHIPTPGAVGITAELAVPIMLGQRVLGVLNVEGSEPFGEEDAESLSIVADQLAVAIENAELYERGQRLAALEERQRLARDLHDSVTQQLFGMVMIAQSLEGAWKRNAAEAAHQGQRLLELSKSALREMRGLLAELRPSGVPAAGAVPTGIERVRLEGLAPALAAHAADFARDQLVIALDARAYLTQTPGVEEALFRIAQEALSNVLKHARARHVAIELRADESATYLVVRDDGVGMRLAIESAAATAAAAAPSPASAALYGGLGLSTMRERAQSVGGTLQIYSMSGGGTRVEVFVPRAGPRRPRPVHAQPVAEGTGLA